MVIVPKLFITQLVTLHAVGLNLSSDEFCIRTFHCLINAIAKTKMNLRFNVHVFCSGKDIKRKKNKRKDVNSKGQNQHQGTDMDAYIDEVL